VFVLSGAALRKKGVPQLTCTGYSPVTEGETLTCTGTLTNTPKYGVQLVCTQIIQKAPTTATEIEKYLASGVIKGIGERMAARIVEKFGENTFEVIAQAPEMLSEVRGITKARAREITEAFHAQGEQRRTMMFLQEYGISPAFAQRIYKKYGEATAQVVRENPYKLADDIDGIGFKKADAIAQRLGIAPDAPARIGAGLRYVLWEAVGNGHVYLPQLELFRKTAELLGAAEGTMLPVLLEMQMERHVYCEREAETDDTAGRGNARVFLLPYYQAELQVAQNLATLSQAVTPTRKAELRQLAERTLP